MAPFPIGSFVDTILDQSKDDAKQLIRNEMESMLDPLVESLFKQLKDKFVHYLEDSSASYWFHQEQQLEHDRGDDGHLIPDRQTISNADQYQSQSLSNVNSIDANCQVNSSNHQPAFMSIKQEINDPSNVLLEPQHNHHSINSLSSAQKSSQFPHLLIPSTSTGESLSNIDYIQPQQLVHIKHNQFDDEECDCDECVDGGIEVKEEDGDDEGSVQWIDEESTRSVKRPKMDLTKPNNAQSEVTRQFPRQVTDNEQMNEDEDSLNHSLIEECDPIKNGQSEAIATECTTNPTQPNLSQPKRHLQCLHCHKSFDCNYYLQRHLLVHTGERPFQCDLCDKRFKERTKLTRHKLVH